MNTTLKTLTPTRLLLGAALCAGATAAWAQPEAPAAPPVLDENTPAVAQPAPPPGPPRGPRILERHDADEDGKLSLDEALTMPRIDTARFNELDQNHDGYLDLAELPQGPGPGRGQGPQDGRGPQMDRGQGPRDGRGPANFDGPQDGRGPRMDRGQGPQGPPPPMRFEDFDTDGNGSLSPAEAEALLHRPRPMMAGGRGPQGGPGHQGGGRGGEGFGPPPRDGEWQGRGPGHGQGRGQGRGFQDGSGRGPGQCPQGGPGQDGPPPPPPPDFDR